MKLYRNNVTVPTTGLKYQYNKSYDLKTGERKKALNRCDSSHVIDSLFDKMFKVAKAKENKDIEIWKVGDDGSIIRTSDDTIIDKRSNE